MAIQERFSPVMTSGRRFMRVDPAQLHIKSGHPLTYPTISSSWKGKALAARRWC